MISPIFGLHCFLEITIFHIRFINMIYNSAKIASFQYFIYTSDSTFKFLKNMKYF